MTTRRILYLTAQRLVAYRTHDGQVHAEASFEPAEAGGEFLAYLHRHPAGVFSLLANVGEEGFHADTIPYLRARDRDAVIERRIAQRFPGAALSAAIPLGYEKTRRKEERVLFAAFNNGRLFEPWLAALTAADAKLAGIHSLPLVAGSLLERLPEAQERCLLVTVQDTTIRQSFFAGGHLRFSRLTPAGDRHSCHLANAIHREVLRMHQYLLGQRLIARETPLAVHVVAHPQALPALAAACESSAELTFRIHDLHALAQRLGLKTWPEDSRADLAYVQAAARTPLRHQFALPAHLEGYRCWQMGRRLRVFGGAVALGCAILTGKGVLDTLTLKEAGETARLAAAEAEQRYQRLSSALPPLPVDNDELRRITDRYDQITRLGRGPAGLYGEISRVLESAPQIELASIDWRLGEPDGAPTATRDVSESAAIRGSLRGEAPPRELLRLFDTLVSRLRAVPGLTVTIEQQPFDLGPSKALKSSDGLHASEAARAFSLIISRQVGA